MAAHSAVRPGWCRRGVRAAGVREARGDEAAVHDDHVGRDDPEGRLAVSCRSWHRAGRHGAGPLRGQGSHSPDAATPRSSSRSGFPPAGWNGKYRQEGNGGWAGAINYGSLIEPLRRGYAVAATDDGHEGNAGPNWAIGHPEKLIDFGHRAVHETSVQAKAIVRAFYGRDADRSYFVGCSDGGREALMEAQRFPEDFNGILAGAPANNWSHLFTASSGTSMRCWRRPAAPFRPRSCRSFSAR